MKKILIFSNGEKIGDGIIKLPFIFDLKKNIPNSEIIWLTNGTTVYKDVLKPFIKKEIKHVWDNAHLNFFPLLKISSEYELEKMNFDLIIDTQKTFSKSLALKRLKSKVFISSAGDWILSNLKDNNKKKNKEDYYLNNIYHMLEMYIEKKIVKKSQIDINPEIDTKVKKLFNKSEFYFGIAPGAGEKNKKWPIENYINLINYFKGSKYKPCFFLGPNDKEERIILEKEFGNLFEPEREIEDLSDIAIVIASTKYLKFAICNDSGVSHMLSTGNCRLFKIFNDKIPSKFTKQNEFIHTISPKKGGSIIDISLVNVLNFINEKIEI